MNASEPWDREKANLPLRVTVEVEGRLACTIRAISRLTGMSIEKIVSKEVFLGTDCSPRLSDFFRHVVSELLDTKDPVVIDNFAAQLKAFNKAGHLHGVDDIDINYLAEEMKDGFDEETKFLLQEAAKIMQQSD